MKILFVGDASNMHNCLAQALRDLGHTAIVASNGSHWMNTHRDIDLKRRPGKVGAVKYVLKLLSSLHQMRDFDVVETCGQVFFDLKPGKVRWAFDWLKRHNRCMLLGAIGTDYVYFTTCHDGKTYRYSDYMVGDQPSPFVLSQEYIDKREALWGAPFMQEHSDYLLERYDGAISYHACGSIKLAMSPYLAIDSPMVEYPSILQILTPSQLTVNLKKSSSSLAYSAIATCSRAPTCCLRLHAEP